ncbi:MAG: hypothetical protein OXQ90_08215 [Gammaproteobacteria bacterium]|nr:hypothetical protein [Gammaproteobacteria bacterium]
MVALPRNRLRVPWAATSLVAFLHTNTAMAAPQDKCRSARRLVLVFAFLALSACTSVTEIRIHNASTLDFDDIEVAGESFGELAAGATGEYRPVRLRGRYAALSFMADGTRVTGQALSFGAPRFTWRIDVVDLAKGWLDIEVVRDRDEPG